MEIHAQPILAFDKIIWDLKFPRTYAYQRGETKLKALPPKLLDLMIESNNETKKKQIESDSTFLETVPTRSPFSKKTLLLVILQTKEKIILTQKIIAPTVRGLLFALNKGLNIRIKKGSDVNPNFQIDKNELVSLCTQLFVQKKLSQQEIESKFHDGFQVRDLLDSGSNFLNFVWFRPKNPFLIEFSICKDLRKKGK